MVRVAVFSACALLVVTQANSALIAPWCLKTTPCPSVKKFLILLVCLVPIP